jgi:hypothetical protein
MAIANFSVVKGDTFTRNCTFRNKSTLVPVNLTGATITGKVGTTSLTCALTVAASGTFSFGLSSAQTAALTKGINPIEVQVQYSDLTIQTLFSGNLVVVEQLV